MKKVVFEFGFKTIALSKSNDNITIQVDDANAPYPVDLVFDITIDEAEALAKEILKLIKTK